MARGEEYCTLEVVVEAIRDASVLIHLASDEQVTAWIPRSCIHFVSDRALSSAHNGDQMEMRIMEWVATKKGLI